MPSSCHWNLDLTLYASLRHRAVLHMGLITTGPCAVQTPSLLSPPLMFRLAVLDLLLDIPKTRRCMKFQNRAHCPLHISPSDFPYLSEWSLQMHNLKHSWTLWCIGCSTCSQSFIRHLKILIFGPTAHVVIALVRALSSLSLA